jgi:exocyst complex protein 7
MTNVLSLIDHRLGRLEGMIIPIHVVIQKLAQVEKSVNVGVAQVENIISLLNVLSQEQKTIHDGVVGSDLDSYMNSMKKIRDAITSLQGFNYRSVEMKIASLVN